MASYDLANRRVSGLAMYVAQNGAADAGRNESPTHSAWPSTTAPHLEAATIERVLAMRAVTRLDYATLLEYTPDPLGDWAGGRHDRLARAELASVGLRP